MSETTDRKEFGHALKHAEKYEKPESHASVLVVEKMKDAPQPASHATRGAQKMFERGKTMVRRANRTDYA
jgi:hypothetical protein